MKVFVLFFLFFQTMQLGKRKWFLIKVLFIIRRPPYDNDQFQSSESTLRYTYY